ncbi:MAG TPA: Crp/Fnr family transcriptional regulator [Nitrospirae bacterium]|nr:cAMP receptor protein [bacterium BMS3Abin06]HDH10734.1 Crp/Fnr family transcriptional regulator [Nitrospirota bacterium]HDZ03022.1 Crp/Fnr family transcriptional regulator [Nitrospirota bacterium]
MIIETLKKSEIFSSLKDEELSKISELFENVSYKNNETIFIEGDPSDKFYLVGEGSVKILKHTLMGKDIILEVMSPGDIFGGVAVLDKKPFPASAQAMESTTVIRISRRNLIKIMEEYPILKLEIVKYFSDKLRDAHEMLKNIATERVEKRVASLLLKLSEKVGVEDGGYRKIDFPLTRQEISEMVGTTVETCIRTMSKFQKSGMIKSSNGRISIKVNSLNKFLEE